MEKLEKKRTSEIYVKRRVVYLRRIIIFTNQIYTNNIYDYMCNKLYSSTFYITFKIPPIQY